MKRSSIDIDESAKKTKQTLSEMLEHASIRVPLIAEIQTEIIKLMHINRLNPAEKQYLLHQLLMFDFEYELMKRINEKDN